MIKIEDSVLLDWHTATKNQIEKAKVAKRKLALRTVLERGDLSFWNDLLKLYLGKKVNGENISFFATAFHDEDKDFPRVGADKLLRSLCAMTLALKLDLATQVLEGTDEEEEETEEEESEEEPEEEKEEEETDTENTEEAEDDIDEDQLNFIIASAVVNSNFLKQFKVEGKVPVLENAEKYLIASSKETRKDTLSGYENSIGEIIDSLDEDEGGTLDEKENLTVVGAVNALINTNKILSEESNILWWLFGEFCETLDNYYSEIGVELTVVAAPKELVNLSKFMHELPAAKSILAKVLTLNGIGKATTNLKKCVTTIKEGDKAKLIAGIEDHITEFTPCLLALKKAGKTDWEKPFGSRLTEDLHPRIIAMQFYREFLFIKTSIEA